MTSAEKLAARIAENREIERRVSGELSTLSLDAIARRLHARSQRASYGAVAGIVGGIAQGVMGGRTKSHEYSWVVAGSCPGRGWPTGYSEGQIHPECLRQIPSGDDNVIDDAENLRRWLQE
jgi:hypothetical protein